MQEIWIKLSFVKIIHIMEFIFLLFFFYTLQPIVLYTQVRTLYYKCFASSDQAYTCQIDRSPFSNDIHKLIPVRDVFHHIDISVWLHNSTFPNCCHSENSASHNTTVMYIYQSSTESNKTNNVFSRQKLRELYFVCQVI